MSFSNAISFKFLFLQSTTPPPVCPHLYCIDFPCFPHTFHTETIVEIDSFVLRIDVKLVAGNLFGINQAEGGIRPLWRKRQSERPIPHPWLLGYILLPDLPQIINNLLENNEERKRIAKNGQRTILEQWPSWEERVRDEVDLVEKLAGNKVGV